MSAADNLRERGLESLARDIALRWRVPYEQLVGRARKPMVTRARRELYVSLSSLGFSSEEVAEIVARDGSTVRQEMRTHARLREQPRPMAGVAHESMPEGAEVLR